MKNLKMDLISNKVNKKIKHFKTENNLKGKYSYNFSSDKNLFTKFKYRLFKLNIKKRLLNMNNIQHFNDKDLFTNILVKNYNKGNNINNLHNNINVYARSTNYINKQNNSNKNSFKDLNNKNILRMKTSPVSKIMHIKKQKNRINNINLALIPLNDINKNKCIKLNKKRIFLKDGLYNNKGELFKKNDIYDKFIKTNYTSTYKVLFKNQKKFLKKREQKEKGSLDSKNEENDMKPKIRLINLKKDLLEENLKINRMFADFNREIAEREKSLKFIGKHKTIRNDLMKED